MDDWNYLAARLTGDGGIEVVETELPLDIAVISRNLSAPPRLDGTITNEVQRLRKNGRPIFEPWNTAILAEAGGLIRGAGIYRAPTYNGAKWELDVAGFTSYAQGTMYDGAKYFVGEDPLNIFRHVWDHIQSQPGGNLGITIDSLTSPVRVGTALEQVQFQAETRPGVRELVSFEAGPRKLNWYDTPDLGKEIDDYAKETPFDWLETVQWAGDEIDIHIKLGYPIIGGRKSYPRLILDENLVTVPSVVEGEYVNQVHVLGAGEGRDAVRGYAGVSDGRLRRTKVVTDKSIKSKTAANQLASRVLAATRGQLVVERLEVSNHPNAPLESIQLGDELQLLAETDWIDVNEWVRVVGRQDAPGESDTAVLTVIRTKGAA